MALSRLRLRLAGSFALAFLAGLLLLSVTLFLYSRRQSDTRLTEELSGSAGELAGAIRIEFAETPADGVEGAVKAALEEWPKGPEAFGVYGVDGRRIGFTGPKSLQKWLPDTLTASGMQPVDLRRKRPHVRVVPIETANPAFRVVAVGTTRQLESEAEATGIWLFLSIPLTVLVSLVAGYLLSRRALRAVTHLEHAIAAIDPDALDRRLPVSEPPDELDRLGIRFNALLQRLQDSQVQNQRFLEQAAHQIRTPLTLVLGEAELALERAGSAESRGEALRRIRLAATQMRRRVEELLLLARATAGQQVPRTDAVELDGVALECADLMRARAHALGRHLELGHVDPVVVTASEPLIREAVVELLENACRHGSGLTPVRISVYGEEGQAVIEVANGSPEGATWPPDRSSGHGLGLQVVRYIASEHGGRLVHRAVADMVFSTLYLPKNGARSHAGHASNVV